jgi:TPR repeat protein
VISNIFRVRSQRFAGKFLICLSFLYADVNAQTMQEGLAAYQAGDYALARSVFEPLAQAQDAQAQAMLGLIYQNGFGVTRNDEQAFKWYRSAAERGNDTAQYNLGTLYETGQGVKRNINEAIKWYRLAADQGHAVAQYNLGLIYLNNQEIKKNPSLALVWLLKAASQGDRQAQYHVGLLYAQGKGVTANPTLAYIWLSTASDLGEDAAEIPLQSLTRLMTEQEIAKNKLLSQTCLASNFKICSP